VTGDYFEVSLLCGRPEYLHFLIEQIKNLGVPRAQIVETEKNGRPQILLYFSTSHRAAVFVKSYQKNKARSVVIRCRKIAYADWAEKWKEDYKIQTIGRRFVVIPAWRKKEYISEKYPKRIPVYIDPLSAFGSGEHETTRLVTRMMETLRGRFDSFLDVGTGTGILSVFAAHFGARVIEGFDSDKPSVECARINFKRNLKKTISAEFRCLELARLKKTKKFDLVAANINSHILENYRAEIVSSARKGGWVLVSGILRQTYDSFREAFDGKDLRVIKILRGRRWVSVLYRKQ